MSEDLPTNSQASYLEDPVESLLYKEMGLIPDAIYSIIQFMSKQDYKKLQSQLHEEWNKVILDELIETNEIYENHHQSFDDDFVPYGEDEDEDEDEDNYTYEYNYTHMSYNLKYD